jgi:hypothetical protein
VLEEQVHQQQEEQEQQQGQAQQSAHLEASGSSVKKHLEKSILRSREYSTADA